jgi:hypothetical protein
MKKFLIWIAAVFFTLLLISSFFLGDYVSLKWSEFISPKKENVRRKVFENTNSYIRGKNQDLLNYYRQYQKATAEDKEAIAELIRTDLADFPEKHIQSDRLRHFFIKIKY